MVDYVGHHDWKLVSRYFHDRSDLQCQHRWYKVLNPDLIKGPWTKEVYTCIMIKIIAGCRDIAFLESRGVWCIKYCILNMGFNYSLKCFQEYKVA